jgi:hypothetical protein
LSAKLDRRLLAYVATAGAAGAGMLSAMPAQAEIIYTPAHKKIGPSTFLDLNHDGVRDFQFISSRTSFCEGCTTSGSPMVETRFTVAEAKLAVYGKRAGNQIYGQGALASALAKGVKVGPGGKFPGGNLMAAASAINGSNSFYSGDWAGELRGGGTHKHYLGLKFKIDGKTHFGWARLNVVMSSNATIQAVLTGYAYETVPHKAIVTGQKMGNADLATPSRPLSGDTGATSLGMLARGTEGLSIWHGTK